MEYYAKITEKDIRFIPGEQIPENVKGQFDNGVKKDFKELFMDLLFPQNEQRNPCADFKNLINEQNEITQEINNKLSLVTQKISGDPEYNGCEAVLLCHNSGKVGAVFIVKINDNYPLTIFPQIDITGLDTSYDQDYHNGFNVENYDELKRVISKIMHSEALYALVTKISNKA